MPFFAIPNEIQIEIVKYLDHASLVAFTSIKEDSPHFVTTRPFFPPSSRQFMTTGTTITTRVVTSKTSTCEETNNPVMAV